MRTATFVFLFVCVAFSRAATVRTASEIRDYENFLRDSTTGKPLSASTDLEKLQTPWSRSGKFEGDILLSENQINMLVDIYSGNKNAIKDETKRWPDGILNYYIDTDYFTPEEAEKINDALVEIEQASCIRFEEVDPEDSEDLDYVLIEGKPNGCFADVGYKGGEQKMNLAPRGCLTEDTIVHEFLHSLGFWHMQSTFDRDDYVRVNLTNVATNERHNFNKYTENQVTNFGTPYDYYSIMHYGEYDFALDKTVKTLEALDLSITIKPSEKMTATDIQKLNALYECSEKQLKH